MKTLEVFSGENRSFTTIVLERHPHAICHTLDCRSFSSYNPTYHGFFEEFVDVIEWESYDIIWFSPPCETYSVLIRSLQSRHLDTLEPRIPFATTRKVSVFQRKRQQNAAAKAVIHDKLLQNLVDVVKTRLSPKCSWFIENPAGYMRRRLEHFDLNVEPRRFNYCCFGSPFHKPTHIWTNCDAVKDKYCPVSTESDRDYDTPPTKAKKCPTSATIGKSIPGRRRVTLAESHEVPRSLMTYLLSCTN